MELESAGAYESMSTDVSLLMFLELASAGVYESMSTDVSLLMFFGFFIVQSPPMAARYAPSQLWVWGGAASLPSM